MTVPGTLLSAGVALLLLFLIFRPLEKTFPAKKEQSVWRPQWAVDLSFFLGQYLVWNGLVLWIVSSFCSSVRECVDPAFRLWLARQPLALQLIGVILIGDLLVYWGHRAQHHVPLLWRFHAVHHSAEHLDWLAAHREHPLDTVYTVCLVNLPVYLGGIPIETLGLFASFRGLWAVYIHSNVRLPIGPLRVLIGAPELHHWHHDRDRFAGNYANLSPLTDVLFGTYCCPDHEPRSFGIRESVKQDYWSLLLFPFRRRSDWAGPRPDLDSRPNGGSQELDVTPTFPGNGATGPRRL